MAFDLVKAMDSRKCTVVALTNGEEFKARILCADYVTNVNDPLSVLCAIKGVDGVETTMLFTREGVSYCGMWTLLNVPDRHIVYITAAVSDDGDVDDINDIVIDTFKSEREAQSYARAPSAKVICTTIAEVIKGRYYFSINTDDKKGD